MSKSKNYERSELSELKETIRKLKAKVSSRDKKLRIMQSELKTLQKALNESVVYIDDRLDNVPVEDVVRYFKNRKKGKVDDVKESFEAQQRELKEKWACRQCDGGYLKLIIIDRHDGKYYIRACINEKCVNRTKMKKYTEDVEGVK